MMKHCILFPFFFNTVFFCALGGESTLINIFAIPLRKSLICKEDLFLIGVDNPSSTVIGLYGNPSLYHLLLLFVPTGVIIEMSWHFNCVGVLWSLLDIGKLQFTLKGDLWRFLIFHFLKVAILSLSNEADNGPTLFL